MKNVASRLKQELVVSIPPVVFFFFAFQVIAFNRALIFVAAALAIYIISRKPKIDPPEWAHRYPANAIGGIATFGIIDRIAGFSAP